MSAELTTAYGAILIHSEHLQAAEFIRSLGEDRIDPELSSWMFTPGRVNENWSDDQLIIGYAATYSSRVIDGYDPAFILKFEHILRNIDFESAVVHIDASYFGDFHAGWVNKKHAPDYLKDGRRGKEMRMIETAEWYFGYGIRDLKGFLQFPADDHDKWLLEIHPYPVQLDKRAVELFNNRIDRLTVNDVDVEVNLSDDVFRFDSPKDFDMRDAIHTLLVTLVLQGLIHYTRPHPHYEFRMLKKFDKL